MKKVISEYADFWKTYLKFYLQLVSYGVAYWSLPFTIGLQDI